MDFKFKNTALFVTLIATLTFSSAGAFASKTIKVPAKVISPRTSTVVYINTDALSVDKLKATAHIFTAAIPNSDKSLSQKLNKAIDQKLDGADKNIKAAQSLQKHIHAVIVSVIPPKDDTKENSKKNSSKQYSKDVSRALILLQGDSSTTAESLSKAFKKANEIAGKAKKEEVPKVTSLSGNWFFIQEQRNGKIKKSSTLPKDAGDSKVAKKFAEILNGSDNPAISIAVISNDSMKKSLKDQAESGGPRAMLASSFEPMVSSLVTISAGSSPALDVKVNFGNEKDVKAADNALSNLLNMAKSMAQMQLPRLKNMMDNPPSSDLINTLFDELQPTIKGNSLVIGLHKQFVQNLAKLAPAVEKMVGPMLKSRFGSKSNPGA